MSVLFKRFSSKFMMLFRLLICFIFLGSLEIDTDSSGPLDSSIGISPESSIRISPPTGEYVMLSFQNSFAGPCIWSISQFTITMLHDFNLFVRLRFIMFGFCLQHSHNHTFQVGKWFLVAVVSFKYICTVRLLMYYYNFVLL